MVLGEFQKDAESVGKNTDKLITALAEQFANMRMNIDGKIAIDVSASGITTTGIVGVSGSEVNPTNIKPQGSSIGGYIPGGRRDADFDTSTPRAGRIGDTLSSRLGRTLARHAQFNSMIAGSRMVTSAYRTDMLGSINSDHVTGRAYDLTGDNLGQYANLVNDSGGFAEFHGSAGSRHLHVVPPQGDAATPAAGMSTLAPSGGVTINAPITVNARDGQSAREIARIVLDQLAALQRTARERQ